jgi:UDP-glucose 4-epimerase
MKILITGGNGFIGRNLKDGLSKRHDVAGPSSHELNMLDERSVDAYLGLHKFDAVIHCATWDAKWNSDKEASRILDHNLRMFFNLSRSGEKYGRLISMGSGAEFSKTHWVPLMKEDYFDTHVPEDQYGYSKYIINKYITHMDDTVNRRLFGVFGSHEDWQTRFISNAICRAIHNLPIVIYQDVAFDYLYIDNLADIVDKFLANEIKEKTLNVCTGATHLLTSLAGLVLEALGKDLPVEVVEPGLGREYSGNNSLLLSEMGNIRFTPMAEAIKELCGWYLARIEQIPLDVIKENARITFLKKMEPEQA